MLKGSTVIELTDTKTGEVERFDDNNIVTSAIDDIILKRKKYINFEGGAIGSVNYRPYSFVGLFPLYSGFFGGLLLFANRLDESQKYITGNDNIIGGASYGVAYSGLASGVGSYNESESEINLDEGYVKLVYDFSTNQCNGTISAVSLANHNYCKYRLYGIDIKDLYKSPSATFTQAMGTNTNGNDSSYSNYLPLLPVHPAGANKNKLAFEGYCYEIPMQYNPEKGHLITFEYVKLDGSARINGIRLHVYDLHTKTIDFKSNVELTGCAYWTPTEVFTKDFSIPAMYIYDTAHCAVSRGSTIGNCDKGVAYVLGDIVATGTNFWTAGNVMRVYKFNLNVDKYDDIVMETLNITNTTTEQFFVSSTSSSGSENRTVWFKDGYMYCPVGSGYNKKLAKINLNDSTDVTIYETSGGVVGGVLGDWLYLNNSNASGDVSLSAHKAEMLNTKTGEIRHYSASRIPAGYSGKPIEIKGDEGYFIAKCDLQDSNSSSNYFSWAGHFKSRNDYLGTINNLDTPVTKTSDKTMKITYILREENASIE